MSALAATHAEMTVEEYLEAEALSDIKHEYLGGAVYATTGASEAHNRIAMNLYVALGTRLRGKSCEPFGSDMKVRLFPLDSPDFYYPDAMIVCDPTDAGHGWRERPAALFEILSADTRRVDDLEKRIVYRQLPSLRAYVRLEQDRPEVIVERRGPQGWEVERLRGLDAILRLPDLDLELPLAELYECVVLPT